MHPNTPHRTISPQKVWRRPMQRTPPHSPPAPPACRLPPPASRLPPIASEAPEASLAPSVASVRPRAQAMLQEVGALASTLSLPAACSDVGCTVDSRARQLSRQMLTALVKFRASLAFCWRGLRVTGQDLLEVGLLLGAAASCKPRLAGRGAPRTRQALLGQSPTGRGRPYPAPDGLPPQLRKMPAASRPRRASLPLGRPKEAGR